MNGPSSASTKYNGPHFCPRCGYNGIYAVNLAMELKAAHDRKSDVYRNSGSFEAFVPVQEPTLRLNSAEHANGARRGPGRPAKSKNSPRSRDLVPDDLRVKMIKMEKDGKTPREISDATDRVIATVYGVLHRARKEGLAAKEQGERSPQSRKRIKLPPRRHNMTCPECKRGGFTPQGLGAHRYSVHGIRGTSDTAVKAAAMETPIFKPLAPREAEAKTLFDNGKSFEEVAKAMNLTVGSAISIKKKIRRKLPNWKPTNAAQTAIA